MKQIAFLLILISLMVLPISARRGVDKNVPEETPTESTEEKPITRKSAKMVRVQLPPPKHDTITGNFIIYWNNSEEARLGRAIDTLTSRAYITTNYGIFDTTLRESIEFGKVDVRPKDTDSMFINGNISYPSNAHDVWVFPIAETQENKVPLYSAHPDTLAVLHYGFATNNIFPLPKRGRLQTERDSLTGHFKSLIADSLARVPRAFFEYQNSVKISLQMYETTPEADYIPVHGSQTLAMMTTAVFELKRPHKRLPLINSLLIGDPNNPIALMRLVEAYAKRDFATAQKHYNHLRRLLNEEDYLLIYARALLLEAQDEIDKARVLYDMALEKNTKGTIAWNRIHMAVLRLTPAY